MSFEVGTGFEPVLTDLQSVASPLGQPTVEAKGLLRADDEARTRDLNLGKVALYQLSYCRDELRIIPSPGTAFNRIPRKTKGKTRKQPFDSPHACEVPI